MVMDSLMVGGLLLEPHHMICIFLILLMGPVQVVYVKESAKVHEIHCWPKFYKFNIL